MATKSTFSITGPSRGPSPKMRSGTTVLCVAASQLLVGLCLLGIYEGYKGYYYNQFIDQEVPKRAAAVAAGTASSKNGKGPAAVQVTEPARTTSYEDPLSARQVV